MCKDTQVLLHKSTRYGTCVFQEDYTFTGRKGILDNGAEAARKHHAQRCQAPMP
jgi:hypothetical protein